ncbi:MAG: thioredoxin family protein [Opitutaceae bacterium]|jgi:protein disulfide-isomerase
MKIILLLAVFITGTLPLLAVKKGDTYEQVIAEKGAPVSKLQAGETLILSYPDQRIKLKANIVVDVNSKLPAVTRAEPDAAAQAAGGWTTNYAGALAQARQQNTKVFLFFTGSDWCGWCKRLDKEILSTGAFQSYAAKNLILVKLDFPRGIPQSDMLKAQNEQLSQKYQVGGFPTVIVLDAQGKEVGKLGYQEGGPGPFIDALKAL